MEKDSHNKLGLRKFIFPGITTTIVALVFGYIKSYISITILGICIVGLAILTAILYYKGIITLSKDSNKKNIAKKKKTETSNHKNKDKENKDEENKILSSTNMPVYKGKSDEE